MTKKNTIESITLDNFMCHSHLEVKFNHRITVIGGLNGSGKSAIMIAIGIAFGMRTYSFERGTSARTLILNGKNTARIEIVLSNEITKLNYGFFGKKIIIERILRRTGSSALKIKSESGSVFGTRKEDLDYILDNLQLHVNNPLNFLTQENSKKFLKNTNASNLYELFMNGTEFNDIIELHQEAKQKTSEMKAKLDILNNELNDIQKRREEKKEHLSILTEGKKLDLMLIDLKREIEWSRLFKILDKRKEQMVVYEGYCEELAALQSEMNENHAKIDELKSNERIQEQEKKKMKVESDHKRNQLEESIRNFELEEREMNSDLNELQKIFDEKQTKMAHLKKLGGLDQLIEMKKELENSIEYEKQLRIKKKEINEELEKEQSHIQEKQQVLDTLRKKESNLQKQIIYMKNLEKDKYSFFHKNMTVILQEIKKVNFKQSVIGPVGIFLHLKESKWQKAISIILRNTLSDFIVFNKEDKNKLIQVFDKFNADFNIVIPSKQDNSAINYYKISNYLVALNVISINSAHKNVILNHLIINTNLERILLIDNRSTAYKILRSEARKGHKYPVNMAYSLYGDKIEYHDGYLSDSRSRVNQMYFEHNEIKMKLILTELKQVHEEIVQLQQKNNINRIQNELDTISSEHKKITNKISDLKIETSLEIENDIDKDIEMLTIQINDLNTQKEEMENNITRVVNAKIIAQKELKEIKCLDLPIKDPSIDSKIQKYYIDNNILERRLQVLDVKISRKNTEIKSLLAEYNQKATVLHETNPLVENARSEEEVNLKIRDCEIHKKLCATLENEETLQSDIKELNELCKHKENITQQFEEKIKNTLQNIQLRIEKRESIKNEISQKVAENFKKLTKKRNYEGFLTFDHAKRNLDLKMKINILAGDKNTLSGGERSFAAMCLILSLWPFIACPVKILDEFDVFMDNLNRDTVLKELIQLFKESELQIILITPLSMKVDSIDYIMLQHPNRSI